MSDPIAVIQSQIESTFARSFASVVKVVHEDGLAMGLNAEGGMVWSMGSEAYLKFQACLEFVARETEPKSIMVLGQTLTTDLQAKESQEQAK